MATETFWTLMRDPAHWGFELFLMALFDGLIFGIGWKAFKRWSSRHDSEVHGVETADMYGEPAHGVSRWAGPVEHPWAGPVDNGYGGPEGRDVFIKVYGSLSPTYADIAAAAANDRKDDNV